MFETITREDLSALSAVAVRDSLRSELRRLEAVGRTDDDPWTALLGELSDEVDRFIEATANTTRTVTS